MTRQLPPPIIDHRRSPRLCPYYTITEDLASIRDESAEQVSQALREQRHIPIEGDTSQIQTTKQVVDEDEQEEKMVTRRKLTADQFLSSSRPLGQPQ